MRVEGIPVLEVQAVDWCEDGVTLFIWLRLVDDQVALQVFDLRRAVQSQPRIIEGA